METSGRLQELLKDVQRTMDAYSSDESLDNYKAVQASIRRLQVAAASPADTLFNFRLQVVENLGVMMLIELGILDALVAKQGASATAADLAAESGCEQELVVRLMRLASALCFAEEVDEQTYRANAITTSLVQPSWKGALRWMEIIYPVMTQLRGFLASTGFGRTGQKPTAGVTAFTFAHGGKSMWDVMQEQPEHQRNFDLWIQERKKHDETRWQIRYPPLLTLRTENFRTQQDAVLMVDLGGVSTAQLVRLREQFPELPGRCILQVSSEKADALKDSVEPADSIEVMAHDLFMPQPIKGARYYYSRDVFHNLPDDKCAEILRNLVPAMDPEYSTLLLDDYVLPRRNVQLRSATADIHILGMFNAAERTSKQYEDMFHKAGLEITAIYPAGLNEESIVEVKVAKH